MPRKKRRTEQMESFVKPEQVALIHSLERVQIRLLSAYYMTRDIGFRIESDVLIKCLGISDEQAKLVGTIVDHYSVGIAVRAISPAGVVGELTAAKIKQDYSVLLADAADEMAHSLRILSKSRSYFVTAHLDDIQKRLGSIESKMKDEKTAE